jgi:hypothetical protein
VASEVEAAIELLAEEVRKLRDQVKLKPDLRQAKVTAKTAGAPYRVTVTIGSGSFPNVKCLPGYVPVVGDGVWVLVMGGGTRIVLGDLD